MSELEFNKEDKYFDLETLITEGTDAKVPIVIEFPNGKKSKALIKPILAQDLRTISFNFDDPFDMIIEILKIALFNSRGELLSEKLIESLPGGLPIQIGQEIFNISGINYDGSPQGFIDRITEDDLESFP